MALTHLAPTHLDYLQNINGLERVGHLPSLDEPWPASPASRFTYEVTAYGRYPVPEHVGSTGEKQSSPELRDLVVTLSNNKVPIAFRLHSNGLACRLFLGTWGNPSTLPVRTGVLHASLMAQFPEVDLIKRPGVPEDNSWLGAISIGCPTSLLPFPADAPLDRIIRALSGKRWTILIVAEPAHSTIPVEIRASVLAESRRVQAEAQAEKAPSPLAKHYADLLKKALKQAELGITVGMWRYAAYLLAQAPDLPSLCGLWKALLSGKDSVPEPIQVWADPIFARLADRWMLPNTEASRGPGDYHRKLHFQTIITSEQLAALIQFPRIDTPGLPVRRSTRFDSAAHFVPPEENPVSLGNVWVGASLGPEFSISVDSLVRHAFVAGVTGAGKTNTIFALLKGLSRFSRRFMVLEPAKTEYRSLLHNADIGKSLLIYTMGNITVAPFFINPFEAGTGSHVGAHLDLLKSLFSSSFQMFSPLPQILERALQAIYEDKGWDLVTGGNVRMETGQAADEAWPTMSDLVEKVTDVMETLGYEERIKKDLKASLITRLDGLRRGAKGKMIDTRNSTNFSQLLDKNVIFELDGIADDDEKAFVMGILMIRLMEERRRQQKTTSLRHLLVIEEAHRLLSNAPDRGSEESANPRAKAVETFANLLSEVRAFGQGFLVADQVPVKLAPDVIKNTNLKIVHRLVAEDDRKALAATMAMNEEQETALTVLKRGDVAAFSEGEDGPVRVHITPMQELDEDWPADATVARHMREHIAHESPGWMDDTVAPSIKTRQFVSSNRVQRVLRDPSFRVSFSTFVLAAMQNAPESKKLLDESLSRATRVLPHGADGHLFNCMVAEEAVEWLSARRGQQRSWMYAATGTFKNALSAFVSALLDENQAEILAKGAALQAVAKSMFTRSADPFPGCSFICSAGVCLHRDAVADYVSSDIDINGDWGSAVKSSPQDQYDDEWRVLRRHAAKLRGLKDTEALRIPSLCMLQHLNRDYSFDTSFGFLNRMMSAEMKQ